MFDKYKIILDKARGSVPFFWKYSFVQTIIITFSTIIAFLIGNIFSQMQGVIAAAIAFVSSGILLIELPNHLNVVQHIQLAYKLYVKSPKEYYFIPNREEYQESKESDSEEVRQTKIVHKRRKRGKKK